MRILLAVVALLLWIINSFVYVVIHPLALHCMGRKEIRFWNIFRARVEHLTNACDQYLLEKKLMTSILVMNNFKGLIVRVGD